MQTRNPKWHRDEIILALDLYFSDDRGSIDKKNPKIIALSDILNALPIYLNRPNKEKFRNPSGVTYKLSNFLSIDPDYPGDGMSHGSKLDEIVFNEFKGKRAKLRELALEIKKVATLPQIVTAIAAIEDDEQTFRDSVIEGQTLYKLHKVRERSAVIIRSKKDHALKTYGKLICEACEFDFQKFYGDIGKDFIECHHRTPLANIKVSTQTTINDLALVCSNCHRMLHREISTLTLEELRLRILEQGISSDASHKASA